MNNRFDLTGTQWLQENGWLNYFPCLDGSYCEQPSFFHEDSFNDDCRGNKRTQLTEYENPYLII